MPTPADPLAGLTGRDFSAVLFDLDGTLIDSGPIILASMQHAVRTVLDRDIGYEELAATVGGQPVFHLVITGSLLTIVPLIAAFLLLQRYWQSGLAAGSVKE